MEGACGSSDGKRSPQPMRVCISEGPAYLRFADPLKPYHSAFEENVMLL